MNKQHIYLSARVKTSTQAATIFGCLLVKPFIISSYTKGTHYIHQSRPDLSPQTHLNNLMFLNQARAGRRPARAWFLKINPVRTSVCVFVCVCVRPRGY